MASVRMTNDLRWKIANEAEKTYDIANPEPQPNNEFKNLVRNAIIDSPAQVFLRDMVKEGTKRRLTKEHLKGSSPLPEEKSSPITAIYLSKTSTNPEGGINIPITLTTPISNFLVTHYYASRHYGHSEKFHVEDFAPEHQPKIADHYDEYEAKYAKWDSDRRKYSRQIALLLDQVTTLKQLLEVWPGAESLVPSEKLQRMHEKVTRKERAKQIKEEVSFDPTVANQAVLAAKMLGG